MVDSYLLRVAPGSRRSLLGALSAWVQELTEGASSDPRLYPWPTLTYDQEMQARERLARRLAPSSVNHHQTILRGLIQEFWRRGRITGAAMARLVDLPRVRGVRVPPGRPVTGGEVRALLQACSEDPGVAGPRDAVAVALMAVGLRRQEVCDVDLSAIDLEAGVLTVRAGKGNRDRLAYLPAGAIAALEDWLRIRGTEPGALLWGTHRTGGLLRRRLTVGALWGLLHRRAKQAGVPPLACHDLRRYYASELLAGGADLALVKALLGHQSVSTTILYDRRPETARRRAAELVSLPYSRSHPPAAIQSPGTRLRETGALPSRTPTTAGETGRKSESGTSAARDEGTKVQPGPASSNGGGCGTE